MPVIEDSPNLNNQPGYLDDVGDKQPTEEGKILERIRHTQALFAKAFDYYKLNKRDDNLKENEGYFTGKTQWRRDIKEKIIRQGRAPAIINQSAVVQNSVSGGERQARTEIKAYAFNADPDDQLESEVSTTVLKYHNKQDDLDFLQSDMFFNGNNTGESWAESYFSRNEPRKPWGVILTRIKHPRNVYLDPNSKEYNFNKDARFVFIWDYIDIKVIVAENPNVSPSIFDYPGPEKVAQSQVDSDIDEYRAEARGAFAGGDPAPFFDSEFHKVKRIRMYEKYRKKVFYLHDMTADDVVNSFIDLTMLKELPDFIKDKFQEGYPFSSDIVADARALAKIAPDVYTVVENFEDRIASHYISGRHEFEYIADIGINLYPVYRYTPFLIDGQPVSYTELFKHPQKEINSMHSKLESMLKRANWLVISEEGVLADNQDMTKAVDTGNVVVKPGMADRIKTWVNPGLNYIGAYVTLIQHLIQMLTSAAGSEDAFRGKSPGANVPGVSLALLRNQTAMIMQPMMDKLNETKRIIAKTQLQMVYTWLDDSVIERIVNQQISIDQNAGLREKIIKREKDPKKQNIKNSFQKLGVMEHDIVFDETISNPTMKLARLHALLEVANVMQTPPPMGLVMKLADLSKEDGDEWLRMFEEQQKLIAMGLKQPGNGKNAAGPDRNLPNQANVRATS